MAMTSFRTALKLELQKLAELAEGGNFNSPPKLEATAPISHSKDYSDIILMLEMSVDESLELDIGSFKQYVLDEWSWKEYNSTSILSNSSVITKYS